MTIINCPHCQGRFAIKALDAPKKPAPEPRLLDRRVLHAVLAFMKRRQPGQYTTAELHATYLEEREEFKAPNLSKQAFAMALSRNGATRWRSATARGFVLEELPDDAKIGKLAPSTAVLQERKDFPASHGGGTPEWAWGMVNRPIPAQPAEPVPLGEPEEPIISGMSPITRKILGLPPEDDDPLLDPNPFKKS
jgi:hypothetical protein